MGLRPTVVGQRRALQPASKAGFLAAVAWALRPTNRYGNPCSAGRPGRPPGPRSAPEGLPHAACDATSYT